MDKVKFLKLKFTNSTVEYQMLTNENVFSLAEYMLNNNQKRLIITDDFNGNGWSNKYLPDLKAFDFIDELLIYWTNIDDIKGIEVCGNLKVLWLDNGDKTLIDFSKFTRIEKLISWDRKGIKNIWDVPTLKSLTLAGLKRNDFKEGVALNSLEKLRLLKTPLNDIDFLANAKNIYFLELLGMSKLENIDVLSAMKSLQHLRVEANKVKNFEFIKSLENLQKCYLSSKLSNMNREDFLNFKQIRGLNISGNENNRILSRELNQFYNLNKF